MMVILRWTLSLTGLCMLTNGFNIDVVHPLVFTDPIRVPRSKSYFGYKVQFLVTQEEISKPAELWILVGAPRANATHPDDIRDNAIEPGRLYRCSVKFGQGGCEEVVVDGNIGCCDTQQGRRPYPIKDNKDFSWLGGAVAVQDPKNTAGRIAVCGHLGKNFIHKSKQSVKVTGVCHFSNHTRNITKNFVKIVPLDNFERGVITHATPNVTSFYYQYGLAGFDIHFSTPSEGPQELIIGAPGVFKWTGTVIRYRDSKTVKVSSNRARIFNKYDDGHDFSDDMVPDPRKTPWLQRRIDNYFGYTVFSGKFSSSNTISYVASAPRGSNMTGRVMIFDFGKDEDSSLVDKVELVGSQVGEYFGASLLALDINKDGLDDLLVGAPLYSSAIIKTSDEGRVYVYINNQGTLKKQDTDLSGSHASFARFGTAIAFAGDMNQDGYDDVLVGAPYENDNKGAVYLYHGSQSGINPKYAQRIGAQDFEPRLVFKGFGIHMTTFDSDMNAYTDVLVGSYLSGHAVLFRTQPIVSFQLNLTAMPNQVTNNNEGVKIRACVSYSAPKSKLTELCAEFKLQLDVKYIYGSRLRFVDRKYDSHIATYKQTLSSNMPNCMEIETEFPQAKVDNSRPIYIQLSAEILDSDSRFTGRPMCDKVVSNAPGSKAVFMETRQVTDTFCTTCPVLDKTDSNAVEISIPFANSCGNKACVADLELTTRFVGVPNDTDFVLGSQKSIGIESRVENHGEPASETVVSFFLPAAVSLVRLPVGCGQSPGKVECVLGSGTLRNDEPMYVRISVDLSSVHLDTPLLEFRSEVSTKSDLKNSTFPRLTNMSINLHTIADVTIIGSGVRELQTYQRPNETFPGSDLVPFSHRYEFVKYQASSLDLVRLEFEFPINLTVNGVVVPITELYSATSLQDNKPLSCKGSFTAHKYDAESEALIEDTNNEINRRSRRDVKSQKSRLRRGHDYPEALAIAAQHNLSLYNKTAPVPANRTSFFNCSMPDVQCGKVVCDAGSIDNLTRISVVLNAAVNIQSLLPHLEKRETIMITSMGFVTILKPENARQPTNHKPDNATASTWFYPTSSQAEDYIPLWILIASGIGGLLILLLIGLILAQCGFFKRKKFDKTEEQSPEEAETTQSHQTQEEDASREFEVEEYYEQ